MYLICVDESGDPGAKGPSPHFILSALIIPAVEWQASFERHYQMRHHLQDTYGYSVREELHADALVHPKYHDDGTEARKLKGRRVRMSLYEDVMRLIPKVFPTARTLSVWVDKGEAEGSLYRQDNYLTLAWEHLFTCCHDFLVRDCGGAPGLVVADEAAPVTVRTLLRRMRGYIPSHYDPEKYTWTIIEDPVFRSSKQSYFVQMADMIAHSLYRKIQEKGSYKQFNLDRFYDYLEPIILKSETSNPRGIAGVVRIP